MVAMTLADIACMLQVICEDVRIEYSPMTRGFYVTGSIDRAKGLALEGFVRHAATPDKALTEFWQEVINLPPNQALVITEERPYRYYRWAGAVWEELQRDADGSFIPLRKNLKPVPTKLRWFCNGCGSTCQPLGPDMYGDALPCGHHVSNLRVETVNVRKEEA